MIKLERRHHRPAGVSPNRANGLFQCPVEVKLCGGSWLISYSRLRRSAQAGQGVKNAGVVQRDGDLVGGGGQQTFVLVGKVA